MVAYSPVNHNNNNKKNNNIHIGALRTLKLFGDNLVAFILLLKILFLNSSDISGLLFLLWSHNDNYVAACLSLNRLNG